MATFTRIHPASLVIGSSYSRFRPYLRRDFRQCCAYCLLHEFWAGGERNFEIDHFRPIGKFPHLENEYTNLYYACHVCNAYKWEHFPTPELQAQGIGYVDLCADNFEKHYTLQPDGVLEPHTPSARYTLTILHLDSPHLVALRRFALKQGWSLDSPPDYPMT